MEINATEWYFPPFVKMTEDHFSVITATSCANPPTAALPTQAPAPKNSNEVNPSETTSSFLQLVLPSDHPTTVPGLQGQDSTDKTAKIRPPGPLPPALAVEELIQMFMNKFPVRGQFKHENKIYQ